MARKKKEEEYTFEMDQATVDFFNNYDGDPWGSIDDTNSPEYLTSQESVDYYNNFFKDYDTELKNYYDKYVTPRQEEEKKIATESKPKVGKDRFTDIGVDTISEEEYQFLVDIDNKTIEDKKKLYKENKKKQEETFSHNQRPTLVTNDGQYYNEYSDKGWIIKNGKYYKPLSVVDKRNEEYDAYKKALETNKNNSKNTLGLNGKQPSLGTDKSINLPKLEDNIIEVKGQRYVEVTEEKPMTVLESRDYIAATRVTNTYDKYFKQFNEAVEKGEYNTANNVLQKINEKYFGHSYEDGMLGFTYFNDKDQNALWDKQDEIFNEKLTIMKALKTTTDAKTVEELNKRLAQLNFEDKLINYNRSITIASVNEKADKLESIVKPVNDSWEKTGELWTETFEDWGDGYQFGDIFGTAKNIVNNTFQTVGSLGKNITGGFSAIENLMFNDLDDGQFKEVWAPAIVDVATYLIPYVGQARIVTNYFEPASVLSSFITQEGSATIDTDDKSIRVANKWNAGGAVVNIAANFLSDMIFAGIKASFTKTAGEKTMTELSKRWFKSSGANIIKNIIKTGSLEAIEEFAQTYGEYMQNITTDDLPPGFFKEHFKEALEAAFVAMVVASGAEGVGSTIGTMRNYNSQTLENYRVNEAVINKTVNAGVAYNSSDIDNYEKLNHTSYDHSQVTVGNTESVTQGVAAELANNNIVTLVNSSVADTDVLSDPHSVEIGNTSIAAGATMTLSPSQEMTNYIKQLNKNAIVFTFDPNSDTFYQDLIDFMENADSRMVFKNISQFTPVDYTFSPIEVNDINKIVTEYRNKGNMLDNINGKTDLKPIKTSDIQDTNITTFMNNIKSKFLEDINDGTVTKETAQKEFKKMSEKLSEYISKSTIERSYMKDNAGKIISFFKTGDNTYEAVNTLPRNSSNLQVYANVKTNGNIINGNLNSKIGITKGQANAVNKMIDSLKLKGNYLTTDSTGKEVATLIKLNKEMSKEILQALGADGIIEGKNKVRLTTAYSGLDNANFEKVAKRTIEDMNKSETKAEIKKQASTVAPTKITKSTKTNTVSSNSTPIDAKHNITPDGDSEFVNMDVAQELDNMFKELEISDSKGKLFMGEDLKTKIKQLFFDSYTHIQQIAKPNNDTEVRAAVSGLESVASNAQTMINNAQIINNEVVGKSLKQIFKPLNGAANKKKKQMFERYMLLELNIERENAGVEKVLDKVSKDQSRKTADKILKKYPEFKGIAKNLQKYNNNLLNMLVEGGVIDETKANQLKERYKFYMPIYSSELSTFGNLGDEKYFKDMKVDNTIKDVTKTAKYVQSLDKSLESKTYNVLSAIAKNKLANAMNDAGNYTSDSSADLTFYQNGKITKMKTSTGIVDDINNNTLLHWVDKLQNDYAVFRGIKALNNIAYKCILDPVYQVMNLMIDAKDSALVYSKDKPGFFKNYPIAAVALANNSEAYNEFKRYGLASQGKTTVEYDSDGNIKSIKESKFDRIYNNLENIPKFAEYLSLKEKYVKQATKDYKAGKFNKNSIIGKYSQDVYNVARDNKIIVHAGNIEGIITSGNFAGSVAVQNTDTRVSPYKNSTEAIVFKPTALDYADESKLYKGDGGNAKVIDKNGKEFRTKENTNKFKSMSDFINDEKPGGLVAKYNEFIIDENNKIPINKDTVEYILISNGTSDEKIQKFKDAGFEVRTSTEKIKTEPKEISIDEVIDLAKTKAAMDAKDVNLDFNKGGKATKALSKAGFKFINAGFLGFDKFLTHVNEGTKTPKDAGKLMLEFVAVGASTAVANAILNNDDEEYEKLPYYYKNNYFMIKIGDGEFLRIPRGRVQSLYNVLFEYATGIRREDDFATYFESIKDSFESAALPPSLTEASPIAAFQQIIENEDSFGNEIYDPDYDDNFEKIKKSGYHLLSSYFGRYGRIIKDLTDNDVSSDWINEFTFYKDTSKANKHYSTAYNLIQEYRNKKKDDKSIETKVEKKYLEVQYKAIQDINKEINDAKESGASKEDMKVLYAARDDLLMSMITNYKNYSVEYVGDGKYMYYFDDRAFLYNSEKDTFTKKW